MDSYEKQLEKQNEHLQERLAEAELALETERCERCYVTEIFEAFLESNGYINSPDSPVNPAYKSFDVKSDEIGHKVYFSETIENFKGYWKINEKIRNPYAGVWSYPVTEGQEKETKKWLNEIGIAHSSELKENTKSEATNG